MERYGLVRSQVYTRINALKAKNPELAPFRAGVRSYISETVLTCLDEVHRLVNEEGLTTGEAADIVAGNSDQSAADSTEQEDSLSVSPQEAPLVALRRVLQTEPLARYELLDKVAERGWRLPTGELALLLGRKELTGEAFECYGYRFTRGDEEDLEISWRVEKTPS
ncbi:hypothetical protein DXZ20_01130 [Leptolyngbyaceae cyanobacterium CCMR0081]|uniref:Uncharacterized protein n=2 Tax=Adonisia TaxID=2950183 RepID=A0A6M0RDB0_9CYAN|nr:hypothetical protein [Adonisia turfae CCMR0081]